MSDIVERLRRIGTDAYGPAVVVAAREAADEIARLRLTDAERGVLLKVREIYAAAATIAPACAGIVTAIDAMLERHAS